MGLGPVLHKKATMLISSKYASTAWKGLTSKAPLGVDGWLSQLPTSSCVHFLSTLKVLLAQSLRSAFGSMLTASAFWAILLIPEVSFAQLNMLNSNGYTGLGIVPSANVLSPG